MGFENAFSTVNKDIAGTSMPPVIQKTKFGFLEAWLRRPHCKPLENKGLAE